MTSGKFAWHVGRFFIMIMCPKKFMTRQVIGNRETPKIMGDTRERWAAGAGMGQSRSSGQHLPDRVQGATDTSVAIVRLTG